jgi:hypothetical protein
MPGPRNCPASNRSASTAQSAPSSRPSTLPGSLDKFLAFRNKLADMGIETTYLDLGGGLGIQYNVEEPPTRRNSAKP